MQPPAQDAAGILDPRSYHVRREFVLVILLFSGRRENLLSGGQLDEVHNPANAGHSAAAFPADAFSKAARRLAANGRDSVVGVNFGERQTGDVPRLYEFENPQLDALV
jgi:hypothetical protein